MSDIDLNELLNRCCKVAEEALVSLVVLETRPFFYWFGEYKPYMTFRVGADEIDDEGEELDVDNYLVTGRLVVAHVTEGYEGEGEENLYTYIPMLKTAFNSNTLLQSAAYPVGQTHLIEARLGRLSGYKIFTDGGVKSIQIGCEFPLRCKFEQLIDYQYN